MRMQPASCTGGPPRGKSCTVLHSLAHPAQGARQHNGMVAQGTRLAHILLQGARVAQSCTYSYSSI